ncbi:putative histidine ammonia-lyase [Trypanosoma rangeli]|uniref:Histidine ammonia-lyase n=1 Tax=Trypanosoma rangeli TaxID=5698 RepID=A0A3R7NPN5_TRYRA|nr:putative histidine ammonia-lyase [Trypanosoma rangeli]RNF09584.1 putative histidine ammonia-lyase [Trypanosoma rangeli]|eukprot:RNF09584.1 putative histidine ammonia-lyase [Trypanosoma rangeli]
MQSQVRVILDGCSLTPDALYSLGYEKGATIELSDEAVTKIKAGRAVIDKIVEENQTVYGINTGFGKFESTIIAPDQLELLQLNLVRSHSACVGEPLTPQRARMMMALRVNILCKGHSGIRLETVQKYAKAFNAGVVPYIPEQGTVGASGDLGPLSHLALGMLGEGRLATLNNLKFREARLVLQELGIEPITLKAKEGLALINGTQFISALGTEAVVRARRAALLADVVLAMSHEALLASVSALNPEIHRVRPHKGQQIVAQRLRSLLHNEKHISSILLSHKACGRVQDAYSIRCSPQVHGISNDVIEWVYGVLTTELNCATDNPLVFPHGAVKVVSCGNFHGEYPAKALDMLAIGVHELGSISERRIERLNNPSLSRLPAFLVENGGLNSGFMIAHCTAAALVSENKVYCHPASVDSISTSAAQEDHVSMGGFAARKAIKVVENVEYILSIELLCACQGVDLLRPLTSTEPLEKVWSLVRNVCPSWGKDREMHTDIKNLAELLRSGAVWNAVKKYIPEEARFLDVFTVKKPFELKSNI